MRQDGTKAIKILKTAIRNHVIHYLSKRTHSFLLNENKTCVLLVPTREIICKKQTLFLQNILFGIW